MDKLLAYKNTATINEWIGKIKDTANHFGQKFIDQYKTIPELPELETADIENLFMNPRSFFVLKLTKGEVLKVGDLTLSSEKVFDLLDRPVGLDDLVSSLEALKHDRYFSGTYAANLKYLDLVDSQLVVKQSRVDEITEMFSYYIESENQHNALALVNDILPKLNQLMALCNTSRLQSIEGVSIPLERIFKGSGSGTARTYEKDLKSIVDAF